MLFMNYLSQITFRLIQQTLLAPPRYICLREILIILFFCGSLLFSVAGCGGGDSDGGDEDDVIQPPPATVVSQSQLTIETAVLDLTGRLGVSTSELGSVLHMFTATGIPYIETDVVATACDYPLIVLVNAIGVDDLSGDEKTALSNYVAGGGRLIVPRFEDSDLFSMFGVTSVERDNTRHTILFDRSMAHPAMSYLDQPEELTLSMGSDSYETVFNTDGYFVDGGQALANYEDGSAAVVVNDYGDGSTFLIGAKFSDLILRALTNHDYEAQRTYSNGFEPSVDIIMLMLKGMYEAWSPVAVFTHTVPAAHKGALILTHDVDAQNAFSNAITFMALEKDFGVRATYNVTTKTVSDSLDAGYYTESNIAFLRTLKENGFNIESHSVGHFPAGVFDELPVGVPDVAEEEYLPYYTGGEIYDATLYGEVVVSKARLDTDLPDQETTGFRSGHLLFHDSLPQVLENSGYTHSSCNSANDVLTNFPFFLRLDNSMTKAELDVLEIPMTISDSNLTDGNVDSITDNWLAVLESNMDNSAVTSLLMHTSHVDEGKFAAQEQLLESVADLNLDLWIGDQRSFAEFWRQRVQLHYLVEELVWSDSTRSLRIVIDQDQSEMGADLTLAAGTDGDGYDTIEVVDANEAEVATITVISGQRRFLVLEP